MDDASKIKRARPSEGPAGKDSAQERCGKLSKELPPSTAPRKRYPEIIGGVALALSTLCAYSNSLSGPFIFDDTRAITENPSIRHLWGSLIPPVGSHVSGRPLLNFSYGLNYAFGGFGVRGYHEFNLLVHLLCGLTVFAIVRLTLAMPAFKGRFERDRLLLSLIAAGLWMLHPINTEAVTYVSERAESLMGLFYLATVYFFVRGQGAARPALWLVASVVACFMGVLTKEVIATSPFIVLLYDRTFCSGSFSRALRLRWQYYLGLVAALLPLAILMTGAGDRGVGFGNGIGWLRYSLISCRSVLTYLKLAVWPHPLVFDYGMATSMNMAGLAPLAAVIAALLLFTAFALWKWPTLGLGLACFFVILAPTSSFIPLASQPIAEHRAYLPLIGLVCIATLGVYLGFGRKGAALLVPIAVILAVLTFNRNDDYSSAEKLWKTTIAEVPANDRAHDNLGLTLAKIPGRLSEAITQYEVAIRLQPNLAEAHSDLGLALSDTQGHLDDAIAQFEEAIRIKPDFPRARNGLGIALARVPGRVGDAIVQFQEAVRQDPAFAEAHANLGVALESNPMRLDDSIQQFEEALRLKPDFAQAHFDLADVYLKMPSRGSDAAAQIEEGLRLQPENIVARRILNNLQSSHVR